MAITMSSGKSRSMAAVLLLVAVVACTCAAGVQAQPSFTIINRCNKTINITTGTPTFVTVPPFGSVVEPLSPTAFFVNPVTVAIVPSTPTPIPRSVVNFINLEATLNLALQSVEIRCVGNSFFIILTYQLPLVPGLLPLIFPFGPFFF